jgi:hypothetical protein
MHGRTAGDWFDAGRIVAHAEELTPIADGVPKRSLCERSHNATFFALGRHIPLATGPCSRVIEEQPPEALPHRPAAPDRRRPFQPKEERGTLRQINA